MKSEDYWENAALQRELDVQADAEENLKQILRLYDNALSDIEEEIQKIKANYRIRYGIDEATANSFLNRAVADENLRKLILLLEQAESAEERQKILDYIQLDGLSTRAYASRIERYNLVNEQIFIRIGEVRMAERTILKDTLINTYKNTYYGVMDDTAKGLNMGVSFGMIDDNAVEAVIGASWHGRTFSERIWKNTDRLCKDAQEIVARYIISGRSLRKATDELSSRFEVEKFNAATLVHTEVSHARSMADAKAYEDLGVDEYKYMATLDDRTCTRCQPLDGMTFKVSERKEGRNYPTMHPRCRCTTTISMDWLQRRARNPKTGKNYIVDGDMTYKDWEASLTPEQGEAIQKSRKMQRNKSADKVMHEKYRDVLGDNVPKSFDKFRDIKYNDSEKWTELKYQYRTVNRYEIDGKVNANTVIKLDNVAWHTKQTGFDYSDFHGKDRERVKNLRRGGNAASMEFDGNVYFAHSRASKSTDIACRSYKGEYPLVELKNNRKFAVKDLGDGISRYHDTEAKFLEFVADEKNIKDKFTVTILSEKHICESCQGVVKQFKERFPNAKVNIISGRRGYNNSPEGTKTWAHRKKVEQDGQK